MYIYTHTPLFLLKTIIPDFRLLEFSLSATRDKAHSPLTSSINIGIFVLRTAAYWMFFPFYTILLNPRNGCA